MTATRMNAPLKKNTYIFFAQPQHYWKFNRRNHECISKTFRVEGTRVGRCGGGVGGLGLVLSMRGDLKYPHEAFCSFHLLELNLQVRVLKCLMRDGLRT